MTVSALCQTGDLEAAYAQAAATLAEQPDNKYAHADMHLAVLTCLKKYVTQGDAAATARWVRKLAALRLPPKAGRDEQLCWELRKLLAGLAKHRDPPYAAVAGLLRDLTGVEMSPLPSVGRSVLLDAALRFKEQLPADWWTWWPLDLLRPEDFVKESFVPKGTDKPLRLPALAEKAYGAYAKHLGKLLAAGSSFGAWAAAGMVPADRLRAEAEALLPRLEEVAAQHPDYGWLPYRRAKLLLALGDTAAALPTLRPIIRQKSTENWAWQLLAETLRPTDAPAALACYYRAAQCPSEEMYLGKVRETLAGMLHENGHLGLAQEQLRRLAQGKQADGAPLGLAARRTMEQPWFAEIYPADKAAHTALLAAADAAAYGDLPWQPVVLQEYLAATAEKPARVRLLPAGRNARPLTVRLKKYPWLQNQPPGTPLQVRCEPVNGFPQAVQLAPRPEGQPWDTRPAQRPDAPAPTSQDFQGPLRLQNAGFGFVGKAFVAQAFIAKHNLQQGQALTVRAETQFDPKKGTDGWVAKALL